MNYVTFKKYIILHPCYFVGQTSPLQHASSRKHDDAASSQSRPPEGATASARPRPARPAAAPDIGAIRLALKMKQEKMEFERRVRAVRAGVSFRSFSDLFQNAFGIFLVILG